MSLTELQNLIDCPECGGTGIKRLNGFVDYSDGSGEYVENKPLVCFQCFGKKQITEREAKCIRIGRHIKEARIEMRVTARQAGALLGLTMIQYLDIEHGQFGYTKGK